MATFPLVLKPVCYERNLSTMIFIANQMESSEISEKFHLRFVRNQIIILFDSGQNAREIV